ncbi:hypothetical protein V6N11_052905 [Hibiscus sabdariffa]|uniref:Uncharacterized protein n=1 Tax=Hibiscus sabdariffa TaxID=183260 RepID=A0ABR2UBH4_9ROSI
MRDWLVKALALENRVGTTQVGLSAWAMPKPEQSWLKDCSSFLCFEFWVFSCFIHFWFLNRLFSGKRITKELNCCDFI